MAHPCDRVAPNSAVRLSYVRPVDVVFELDKYTHSALVSACNELDVITSMKRRGTRACASHSRAPVRHTPAALGAKFRLIRQPRLFELGLCYLLLGREPGSVPLRRFLVVESFRLDHCSLEGGLQLLQHADQEAPQRDA